MKISFKVFNGNKVASNNNSVLSQYIISEDGLDTALEIATLQNQSVWDFLSHKKLFVALPMKKDGTEFRACMAFVVRRADGTICIWSNQYLNFENGDAVFTTKGEAAELAEELNVEQENAHTYAELSNTLKSILAKMNENRDAYNKIMSVDSPHEIVENTKALAMKLLDEEFEELLTEQEFMESLLESFLEF